MSYMSLLLLGDNKNLFPLAIIDNAIVKFLPVGANGRIKASNCQQY